MMKAACAALIEISTQVDKEDEARFAAGQKEKKIPQGAVRQTSILTEEQAEQFFMQYYDDEAIDKLEYFKVVQAWIRKDETS